MSLQVWMPLTNSIKNNGLSSIYGIFQGNHSFTDGKIGLALTILSDGDGVVLPGAMSILSTYSKYSMACWVYVELPSTGHSATIISSGGWNQAANQMCFALYNYDSGYRCILVPNRVNWSVGVALTNPLHLNTWYHIAITYDGTNTYAYVDGAHVGTLNGGGITPTSEVINAKLFAATYYDGFTLHGKLNDFRIYDHCLSIKEIKELAKAKVLHYKLSSNKPATNLITNSTFSIYNNYPSNISASITAMGEEYQGAPVYRLTMQALDQTGLSIILSGLADTGVYGFYTTFKANTKYCFWIYYRPVWPHENVRVGGAASNIAGWTEIPSTYYRDGWYRVGLYRNGSVAEDKADNIFTSFYCSTVALHLPISIDFCCPHLVEGYDYIVEEDGYLYDSRSWVEYDLSGNNYTGIISGTLEKSLDSPRYNGSYVFTNSQYITCPVGAKVKDEITVNIWAYMDSWSQYTASSMRLVSCAQSGGWNFEPGSGTSAGKIVFVVGTGASSNTYKNASSTTALASLSSGWHMFTGTYDGLSTKLYIDGTLEGTNNAYTTKTPIYYNSTNTIFVGAEALGSMNPLSTNKFSGKLSDFRIYGTALSAENILELYKTGATVDNIGNIYSGEFIEVDV